MDLTTQFDIGQQVWHVWDRIERETETCSVCSGAGKVQVVGSDGLIGCPKCYGKGETSTGEHFVRTVVRDSPMTVGQVNVTIEGPTYGRSEKREERYMMIETGVGSGTLYYVKDIFATQEEAEAEARRRTEASVARIGRYSEVDGDAPE